MEIGKNILENLDKLKEGRELNHSEILEYLSAHNSKFWSWGADKFTKMTDSTLRFKVNGHHHKGHVYIFLNFMDTFDIYLTTSKGIIQQVLNEVYIDELFNLLDEKIEKIPAYKY